MPILVCQIGWKRFGRVNLCGAGVAEAVLTSQSRGLWYSVARCIATEWIY